MVKNFFSNLFSGKKQNVTSIDNLKPHAQGFGVQGGYQYSYLDGDKFVGGFGPTQLFLKDYWQLRQTF